MSRDNTLSRRNFLGALTALGSLSLTACATASKQTSRLWAADRTVGLPPRGEFVVRNAYIVTMDPQLGDIPRGDVHVRDGTLVAVGPNLAVRGVEEIDGSNRIVGSLSVVVLASETSDRIISRLAALVVAATREIVWTIRATPAPATVGETTNRRSA